MKYNFYGWRDCDVSPVNKDFVGIDSPTAMYDALLGIWCEYTCAPRLREKWSKENITLGQCSVTAFLVQDVFGGKVFGVKRPAGNYHCYNVVGDTVFDLTSEQFGDEILDYSTGVEQNRGTHFEDKEKKQRYDYLRTQLKTLCQKWSER